MYLEVRSFSLARISFQAKQLFDTSRFLVTKHPVLALTHLPDHSDLLPLQVTIERTRRAPFQSFNPSQDKSSPPELDTERAS